MNCSWRRDAAGIFREGKYSRFPVEGLQFPKEAQKTKDENRKIAKNKDQQNQPPRFVVIVALNYPCPNGMGRLTTRRDKLRHRLKLNCTKFYSAGHSLVGASGR
jgi:hypothetical protein